VSLGLPSVANLRVVSGPLAGEQIAVERVLTIGRHGADVVIDDPELSRRHLEVRPSGDMLIVEDLGSTNGTLVDGRPIDGPTRLGDGARLKLGSSIIEVEILAAQVQATRLSQQPDAFDATRVSGGSPPATEPGQTIPAPPSVRSQPDAPAAVPGPEQLGAFNPPTPRRAGGLASRSWIPVVLSFGSAIFTAIALVIYFAQR
jgi:predicted component of type VI protein secretion system